MASSAVEIWDLPEEVLLHIFSQLNKEFVIRCVMNVCAQWKAIVAENKIFWNDLFLVIDCDKFMNHSFIDSFMENESFLKFRMKFGPVHLVEPEGEKSIHIGEKDLENVVSVQCLKFIGGSQQISQSEAILLRILDVISRTCNNIKKIEFSFCVAAASNQAIRFLTNTYRTLEELWFDSLTFYKIPCDEVSRFPNLKTLVCQDIIFRSSDLYHLSEGCEQLSSLWLLMIRSLKTDDLMYFLERKKPTLQELGICIALQDGILEKVKECQKLEVFFASDARQVTDDCLKSFAYQSSLKYCSLHQATFELTTLLEVVGFSRKPQVFQHLKVLDLTGYANFSPWLMKWNDWNLLCKILPVTMPTYWYSGSRHIHERERVKPTNLVYLTFSNPYERSISLRHKGRQPSASQDHWMYCHRTK